MQQYYVYVDITLDTRVPFYVGKGNLKRTKMLYGRNKKHDHIRKKHGQIRFVVLRTNVESQTKILECQLIMQLKTQAYRYPDNTYACNFTDGGEGNSGGHSWNRGIPCSSETKILISSSLKGTTPWNKGVSPSEETRKKIGDAGKGREPPNKGRPSPLKGRPNGKKGTKNTTHSMKLLGRTYPNRRKPKHYMKKNIIVLTNDIHLILERIHSGETRAEIAREYKVSLPTLRKFIKLAK